jgi:NADP-dependent 3-hydroxy acid dehydrogenase YdfG
MVTGANSGIGKCTAMTLAKKGESDIIWWTYMSSCLVVLAKYIVNVTIIIIKYSTGATVHMVCRNQERGEQAKQDIMSESGNDVSWRNSAQDMTRKHMAVSSTLASWGGGPDLKLP